MKKKINVIFWWIFLVIYLEILYKHFIFRELFTISTLYILLFSIPVSLLFYLICNLWNKIVNRIFNIILSFIIPILFIAQVVYYKFYATMFSVFSLTTGTTQVFGFFGAIMDVILQQWHVIVLMLLPIIFFLVFNNKLFDMKRLQIEKLLIVIGAFIVTYSLSYILILVDNNDIYSMNRLYTKTHSPILSVSKMGLMTMERLDLKRYIFGFEEDILVEEPIKEEIIDNKEEKEEEIVVKYNKLDIDFDKLIKKEKNKTIIKMHKYFRDSDVSKKNEYTGLFKDKNLVFITAEGLDVSAIRKDTTPTLYNLVNNGFVFDNYYQPLYPVSTSDGEYMNLTGLIPKEGVWSFYRSSSIDMPFTLGNMFNKLGYKSLAYHNNSYTYYDRNLSHPNMGFDYTGCGNGLEKVINCKIWPESDLEMINATYKNYINEEHFLTYYMSVSGHLRYNTYNSMAIKNWDMVENLTYSTEAKAYLATNIELDKALESLISKLKKKGILDDTVIVIAPDHYPYGLTTEQLNEISEEKRNTKFRKYHTSFILYNSEIEEPIKVTKTVSSIDILPTIYNLFGINFDSRLFIGRDMLSDSMGIAILSDRSWVTDKGKYNSINDTFYPNKGQEVDDKYVDTINTLVYNKFTMSSYILSKDYYSKLGL